jgi:hypothetical protein
MKEATNITKADLAGITRFCSSIFWCPQRQLPRFFSESIAPLFFGTYPNGRIVVVRPSIVYAQRLTLTKYLYSLSQYPDVPLQEWTESKGFLTLTSWGRLEPWYLAPKVMAIAANLFYPYITFFKATNFSNIFFLFVPETPLVFNRDDVSFTWRDVIIRDAALAEEYRRLDKEELTGDLDYVVHRRYKFKDAPSSQDTLDLIVSMIGYVNKLGTMLYDVSQFPDKTDPQSVDPVYAFEYFHSIMHMLSDAVSIMGSSIVYWNKAATFRIADTIVEIAKLGSLGKGDNYFKELFRCDSGKPLVSDVLGKSGVTALERFAAASEEVYEDLKKTILELVFIKSKRTAGGVLVKSRRDPSRETMKPDDEFCGDVIRVLRNTHHGYMTRGDAATRPSRFLSLITGNISDDLPLLAIAWVLSLMVDPQRVVGNP